MSYLNPHQARARLPVVLLSGFLGCGKTTLVNRLLRDPRLDGTAVAINEFGEVPLDAHLIDHGADKTVVLANGCLCCNLAGDLEDAVMRIFSRRESGALPDFKRLIIEPSGLADPAPIAQAILRNPVMSKAFRLEGIITAVDALFAPGQIADHPETVKQIAIADRLVITKGDLAGAAAVAAVRAQLQALNPAAAISEYFDATLLPPAFLDDAAVCSAVPRTMMVADCAPHVAATHAVCLVSQLPLDWRAFDLWLRDLRLKFAPQLLRVKAILNVTDSGLPVVIHGVHHVLHTPEQLTGWPDDNHESRIVFITRGLAAGTIEAAWRDALPSLNCAAQAA
jgi:G3E family GTPase